MATVHFYFEALTSKTLMPASSVFFFSAGANDKRATDPLALLHQ